MISLTADQQTLAYGRALAEVKLLRITTYSDRGAGTVSDTFYFSDESVRYDYANTGTVRAFEPVLASVDLTPRTMPHVPSPDGGDLDNSLRATMRVRIKNEDLRGQRVLAHLKADPIEFASVEYATLLIDPAVKASSSLPYRDASALVGNEHVVRFRGVVGQMIQASDESIDLEFRSETPEVDWQFYDDPTLNDPLDLGQRMPIVYGHAEKVACGGWEIGFQTTLAQVNRSATATGSWTVTDSSGFPTSGPFDVMISGERITCTGKGTNTITVGTRGVGGTIAAVHAAGEIISEVPAGDVVWIAAGHEVSAINKVYARNPFNEEIVQLETATLTTLNANDTTTISGRTVASITMTPGALVSQLQFLSQQAAVTQQPVVSHPVTVKEIQRPTSGVTNMRDGNPASSTTLTSGGSQDMGFPAPPGTLVSQTIFTNVDAIVNTPNATLSLGPAVLTLGTMTTVGTSLFKVTVADGTGWDDDDYRIQLAVDAGDEMDVVDVWREIEYLVDDPTLGTGTAIEASASGYGLRLFADVDGYKVPAADSTYDAAAGALIIEPPDAIHHFLAVVCGLGNSAVDYNGTFATTATGLGPTEIGCDIRNLGYEFAQILARMAFETRANIIDAETVTGTQWRLLASQSGYAFASASIALESTEEGFEVGRDIRDIGTRWLAYSDFDVTTGGTDEASFRKIVRASSVSAEHDLAAPTLAEMATADTLIGVKRQPPVFFLTINDTSGSGGTLEEVFGYYVHEGIALRRVFVDRVPHWQGYALERGDLVNYTPAWEGSAAKCRVIEVSNSDTEGNLIRLAEVE